MEHPTTKSGLCRQCGDTSIAQLHRRIQQNGAESFVWRCQSCKTQNPFGGKEFFISKTKVEGYLTPEQIEALPIIMPNLYLRCCVCGSRGAELHHWAPRAIFGDECDDWPQDALCDCCHKRWHSIVTPQLIL